MSLCLTLMKVCFLVMNSKRCNWLNGQFQLPDGYVEELIPSPLTLPTVGIISAFVTIQTRGTSVLSLGY